MSARGEDGLRELDAAVGRALEEIEQLRRRADEAERRSAELELLLAGFQVGDENPAAMKSRLNRLEAENRDLHDRIARGRETVERLIARIRFLEDQKP